MKSLNLAILLATTFLLQTAAGSEQRVAPDWTLTAVDGTTITLSETTAEKPAVLFFWATWCPYCKLFMPHLQEISTDYGDQIDIFAIHFRDDAGDPVAYMQEGGFDFTLLPDGGEVAELNDVWGTPGVLLIDRGRIVRFDLYELPKLDEDKKQGSHRQRAARLAPYWAKELRKAIDSTLALTDPIPAGD